MTQAQLGTVESAGGQEQAGEGDDDPAAWLDEDYGWVDYLDTDHIALIRGFVATLNHPEEIERLIEGEQKRWDRTPVIRMLERKKAEFNSESGKS